MAKVIPNNDNRATISRRRNSSVFKNFISQNRSPSSLDTNKFNALISSDFASGFEESFTCFSEISSKSAATLGAQNCSIFILDEKEHYLYTFSWSDHDQEPVKITKPVDRGITGFVLSDSSGINLPDVSSCSQWLPELDDCLQTPTKSYMAWPLWDSPTGTCIGVVEFRNKNDGQCPFDHADCQMAQIVAFQLGRAIVYYRQQTLLDGRNKAINMAYSSNFDSSDSIDIHDRRIGFNDIMNKSTRGKDLPTSLTPFQRNAIALTPSWSWKPGRNNNPLKDRDWAFDVFLHTSDELSAHAAEIFDERGLFSRFSIPNTIFINFVKEIIAGYNKDAPYHNHFHAFDVMHVCYMFITKCKADDYLDSFNTLAILVGALAHDLGHDGFNNAFHAATNSELAITYNGMSILENYSAAYLFRILRKEKCNIFARLSDEHKAKMRARLIDLIIDTDAKNHFMLMTRFKHALEMKQLPRGLLCSMLLHTSDVSNPFRPGPIARKWAYAVQEEFFRQGDKEKELGIPKSPFMDRVFENLPRMQGAFIDALVTPVMNLLAEILPLANEQCIKTLQSNRAFWNSMLSQGIITTEDIKKHLSQISIVDKAEPTPVMGSIKEASSVSKESPIPGIPENAPKELYQTTRKMSLISIKNSDAANIDPELGQITLPTEIILLPPRKRWSIVRKPHCYDPIIRKLNHLLHSFLFQTLLVIATAFALFANDLNMAIGNKASEHPIYILTVIILILFILEMVLSLICSKSYIKFFFWLDLAASVSLLLDIDFLLNIEPESSGQLSLARAGRAAKVGARAGRIAKVFRLIKLVKAAKLLKWTLSLGFFKKKNMNSEETDDDVDLKMSVVGRRMTESITKKVIFSVMIMFLVFSLTDFNDVPDSRQILLDAITLNPESDILWDSYRTAHDNLIEFVGLGRDFSDEDRISELRDYEIFQLTAATDANITASFDVKQDSIRSAWYSFGTTMVVTILLGTLSLLFSKDAYSIMIRPIEKMKSTIQKLSENPLLHLERLKKHGEAMESNETDILEQAITKMATLLQVGFGTAGAEIIGKSLSDVGELNPIVPGLRVHAIFGFCDIREFTFATEQLQEDVMLFVNKIAKIVHKHVVDSEGAPNKNIGDAFLLVWKLSSSKDADHSLEKYLFDAALFSIQNIQSDINRIENLRSFMMEEDKSMNKKSVTILDNFKVSLGFGLHTGWAIEGSIGSKVKIDASYLSPHVNLASRLEAATKHYSVPLLMSDAFVSGLSGTIQSTCRRVDKVTFKGSKESMTIFHLDVEPFENLKEKPTNYANLLSATSWDNENEIKSLNIDLQDIMKALKSDKNMLIRGVYDAAFNAYLDGQWKTCKCLFHLWMERFPGDKLVHNIVEFIMKHNFQCPDDWLGYRVLQEK